ncbi:MAG: PhzF family phenazine biosynthesis protein [Chitinophagaceae bacterium]|nr:PhzF family phenazine biosynthesis protein [Chitinophagaceae bacterium]
MKTYPLYKVDAFTNKVFGGNPAAVVPLQEWLPANTMQLLAMENNLSETAFFVKENDHYHIRWFTPEFEIDLCGHATLASACIIFEQLNHPSDTIKFNCESGELVVKKMGDRYQLNFPSRMPVATEVPEALLKGFDIPPKEILKSRDYFLIYENEEQIKQLKPDFNFLNQVNVVGIIVTAPGKDVDFVSRFFVPNSVIGEDPVTGSAHCSLIPYWSKKLNKQLLTAKQLSQRLGTLWCENLEERVTMAGNAVLYAKGEFYL